jgi:hypothetical protein
MPNEILNFLQKLLISKHGDLTKARYYVNNSELSARCPYCLDSKTNPHKKRFYYSLENNLFFCHNCQRKGPLAKLLHDFRNLPGINYEKIEKEIGFQKVKDFIDGEHRLQDQEIAQEHKWEIEFPDGARLDTLISGKQYKKLPQEDKQAILKAIRYLGSRGVKKEWFHYFYFVFPGSEYDQYILTLFEYKGDWVWSGRKIDSNRTGPKYLHLQGFPFHEALGFANEVSLTKGQRLYVVESWFSALLLNQARFNCVCVFGLQHMRQNHPPLDAFRKKYELVFLPDNDDSLSQFITLNKDASRKMKMILLPDKDAADYVVRSGDQFRKQFLKLQPKTIHTQNVLRELKSLI